MFTCRGHAESQCESVSVPGCVRRADGKQGLEIIVCACGRDYRQFATTATVTSKHEELLQMFSSGILL